LTAILEAKGLKKRYAPQPGQKEGHVAVKGLNMHIEQGEIFSLLGPNGAGKTTSISMMSGLIAPTEGDVWIGGKSITRQPMEVKKLIGVVPQEIALYPELSARANLEFFGKMYGLGGAELAKRCDEVLDYIGLKDRQHERISSYSGASISASGCCTNRRSSSWTNPPSGSTHRAAGASSTR
jgi:ABC-2 type transport system ATP-binding protein